MNIVIRRLVAKELYLNRWMMAGTAVATVLAAIACLFGRMAFNIGALAWMTAIIACGVMLAIYGVAQERKEQSLQFVLSLPVSIRGYVFAKTAGLLLSYLVPWLVATAAAIVLVLASPAVLDGLLPYVVVLSGFLLANFSVVLCAALHVRSEAAMVAVIVLTNMAVSIFMFVVGAEMRAPAGAHTICVTAQIVTTAPPDQAEGNLTNNQVCREINVIDMINKSRGDVAYNLIDIADPPAQELLDEMRAIDSVINVRVFE